MNSNLHLFSKKILRAYDIRGIFGQDLFEKDAYYLAKSLVTLLKPQKFNNSVFIGYDGRKSSKKLFHALSEGFKDSGVDVHELGLVPTPTLYFAAHTFLEAKLSIMITGSHNPAQYNGFKIVFDKKPLYGKELAKIYDIAQKGDFYSCSIKGVHKKRDISAHYIDKLLEIPIKKSLKIAWDPGGGAACEILKRLLKQIPGKHVVINGEIDSDFSSHHPDPTQEKNMLQLVNEVTSNGYDLGIAFDGDADRLGVVTSDGKILYGEQILSILSYDLLKQKPRAKIIADVKTSRIFFDQVERWGGIPIMWKTGHALIKEKMREINAPLAGEMSGHIFFNDGYYGFDDAIFGALKFINIFISNCKDLNSILDEYETLKSTPEVKIRCDERLKFKIIKKIKTNLIKEKIPFNDLDGVRVEEENGWWLIRASNTENCIITRAEAFDYDSLQSLINKIKKITIDSINA